MSNWMPESDARTRVPFTIRGMLIAAAACVALSSFAPPLLAQNAIVVENAQPGNPASEWDIIGIGDPSIRGFATDISVDAGETVHFKVDTDAADYRIDIYRLGWYGGLGARKVATVLPSAALPQIQPADLYDPVTGMTDCGNWAESASWLVPANATSGVYIGRLVRTDTNGANHILFVVRDDDGGSDVLFQIADATWQAYNDYGGNSLYEAGASSMPNGHATKVSYNRPFETRDDTPEDWVFNADYPLIRWLEANGYDVSYFTNVDTERHAALIATHEVFLSVGHDEYWSAGMRANVEAALAAGTHFAFLSGNEIYWKTRWEPSSDPSATPLRTLVCYKEGTLGELACGGKCDPSPTWTGLWRDGCAFSSDGCRPENALSGQISWDGSTGTIQVPHDYAGARLWRNTAVASLTSGQTANLAGSSLGYEWDFEQYPEYYPPGRVRLSRTVFNGKTHHLSLWRHASGALVFGAGTVQWSWGLDGTHDRGGSVPNAAMRQSTVNLFAEMGVQPETLQPGLVAATASGDATAPVSTIGFPLPGSHVPANAPVVVSGTASDAAGVVGAVEVSVDGGATWSAAIAGPNWTFTWTPTAAGPVTIRTRAADDWGNLEAPGPGISVTVDPPGAPACPCVIWPAGTEGGFGNDGQPVEVGVRFRAEVDGVIEGVRFYKQAAATGVHIGSLWTNTGTLLASATFTGETASGWQEVLFGTPVEIDATTTYVASVHLPSGHYAFTGGYFATTGFDNPPLHALATGVDGANGVYRYGAAGNFPTETFNASNYWVDVRFNTEAGPDETPPLVTGIAPGNGAAGVAVGANVTATFNEALDPLTVTGATIELRDPSSALVAATVTWDLPTRTARLDPTAALAHSTTYTATVRGGAVEPLVRDVAGNALAATLTWSFTTAAPPPPPPTEGPGGPILVVSTASNPFSRYPVEILRTEGLNAFTAMDVSLVTPAVLADHDVAILGEMPLTAPQVAMLTDWVTAGGNLVAMRPGAELAPLLGLDTPAGTLANQYLLIDTASGPGVGLVAQTLQFHGTADLWSVSGASVLATLYADATTATAHPAVTLRSVGPNGGQAAAFTFDLARSVVYTRQGNPAWAGQERDAPEGAVAAATLRATDMFYGNAPGDPQPDWIDFSKVAIPQADEQQRLLANLVLAMNLDRKPLPRFWYFPRDEKAVVIMTGDNHGDGGMASRFQIYANQSPPGCSVDDWECIRASGYLYVSGGFTDAQALGYQNQGFETGVHINTGCNNWDEPTLRVFYDSQLDAFANSYPSLEPPSSNRTHCGAWSDWATQARVQAEKGIRLDTNYYYWPPGWVQNRPGLFTGSGMPMRFADLDGTLIDCYQAPTQMTDESGQTYPFTVDALLDRALGPEGYYGAFVANMHFDSSPHASSDDIVASAVARGVPVVSARQMIRWLDGRNGSSFGGLTWTGNTLEFDVAVGAGATGLRGMVPRFSDIGPLTALTRDGQPVAHTFETVKGVSYAVFPAAPGSYVADYSPDATPPVITAVNAVPHVDGSVDFTWTTDEPSDSRVDYGTSPGALAEVVLNGTDVTSHLLTATGLAPSTTYYYRVTSTDVTANTATEPAPPAAPLSFTTPAPLCLADDVDAHFAAGTHAGTAVAHVDDGEVILAPTQHAEFEGTSLPAGWGAFPWSGGGSAVVGGGVITIDGARVNSLGPTYGPGRAFECVATFTASPFQAVGFGGGGDISPGAIFDGPPWAIFSTGASGSPLMARTHNGSTVIDEPLGAGYFGAPRRYRIEWTAGTVEFFIDGVLVASHTNTIAGPMRPAVSEFNAGGPALAVDWIRMTPYPAAGTFDSRVYDSGGSANWGAMAWNAEVPAGTSLAMSVRTGSTPVPDGSWSAFVPVPVSGADIAGASRYIQYRAALATTNDWRTPELRDVAIACDAGPDLDPPLISNVQASPAPSGTEANVTWTTDEPANSRVDYGTTPALGSSATLGAFVVSHAVPLAGLTPNTLYHYRVTSADAATNASTEPVPPATLTFTTPIPVCVTDGTWADFDTGSDAGTYVANTAGGEVVLAPAFGDEFEGSTVFLTFPWSGGGSSTVTGGRLIVDGACANSPGAGFGPGSVVEFVATFSATPFQHVGFGAGVDGQIFNGFPIAIFSTGGVGTEVMARTGTGSPLTETGLGAGLIGTPHLYRLEWTPTTLDYYVDGVLAASHPITIGGTMRPAISDFNVGGASIAVDWLRMRPYAPSGVHLSRVLDGGGPTQWGAMTWSADVPAGTSFAMSVRTGDTPTPDGSWTAFVPVPLSGGSIGTMARYLQYRGELATTNTAETPALTDVSLACVTCTDAEPPAAVTNACATLAPGPADADGTWPLAVAFTAPPDAATVEVYRADYGGYPEYDDAGGNAPSAPAYPPGAPWTLTAVTATGQTDDPPARGYWTYVVFTKDACGNVSAVSNLSCSAPNYLLGDFHDTASNCAGDNAVDTADLSFLGAHYGAALGAADPLACLDVGPTTDFSVTGRPLTDHVLDFEDLVVLALNYGETPGPAMAARIAKGGAARATVASGSALALDVPELPARGETFVAHLRMSGAGDVQAAHLELGWNRGVVELVAVEPGDLVAEAARAVAWMPAPGVMDIAALGRGNTIDGHGTLLRATFRRVGDGEAGITLARVDARGAANQPLALGTRAEVPLSPPPTRLALGLARPNPFSDQTTVELAIARVGRVRLEVFDLSGRRVRTLLDADVAPGSHTVSWDGRSDAGAALAPGLYEMRLQADAIALTRRVALLK